MWNMSYAQDAEKVKAIIVNCQLKIDNQYSPLSIVYAHAFVKSKFKRGVGGEL